MSGKSFLEAWQAGEIGGFSAQMDIVHEIALLENERRDQIQAVIQSARLDMRGKVTALVNLFGSWTR